MTTRFKYLGAGLLAFCAFSAAAITQPPVTASYNIISDKFQAGNGYITQVELKLVNVSDNSLQSIELIPQNSVFHQSETETNSINLAEISAGASYTVQWHITSPIPVSTITSNEPLTFGVKASGILGEEVNFVIQSEEALTE